MPSRLRSQIDRGYDEERAIPEILSSKESQLGTPCLTHAFQWLLLCERSIHTRLSMPHTEVRSAN